jgi:microcystin degradation protein MlrC
MFMATLSTETNTFSPVPTVYSDFQAYFLRHGTVTQEPANLMTEALHLWRARAEALDWQVTESLTAIAEPAGLTTHAAYAELTGEILNDLRAAGQPDVILLQLHGAMIAEGEDDCEGDLVSKIRTLCPDAVIGVSLDLHCHLRDRLLEAADLVITFREYPHDDATPRAQELFDLAHRVLKGEIKPVMAMFDCRMVSLFLTKTAQMRSIIADINSIQATPGILSVSLAHGFPWADMPDTGARMLVIADGDPALAQRTARDIGQRFFEARNGLLPDYPNLDDALNQVEQAPSGPVVLADMSDNSGAGAPGDATYVLHSILNRGMANVASGLYWDSEAVQTCVRAGAGATVTLNLGGKAEPASGKPVEVSGTICAIKSGLGQHLGTGLEPLGTVVWLRLQGDVDLLINDLRIQVYHPEVFEQMGIALADKHLVVVKSLFHFYSPFAAIAEQVIFCATPGRVNPDTRRINYTHRDLNFWPRVDDPFASSDAFSSSHSRKTA